MRVGSLFSGVGLLDYGLHLAGFEHEWLCEVDPFRRGILAKRFPGARIYDDVRSLGGDAERVDLIAGGFPCKGASTAGKRQGLDHPETALWREMYRIVRELRPQFVLIENVANILSLHDGAVWGTVLGDLAESGYDAEWDCLPAAAFGAPHLRDRVFAVATDATHVGPERTGGARNGWPGLANSDPPAPDPARHAEGGPGAQARAYGERVGPGADLAPDAEQRNGSARLSRRQGGERQPVGPGVGTAHAGGVRVEWGALAPAIARWEAIHGPAPEPLVRRVDDRGAARVERSRLSALGDGVLVHAGRYVGEIIMSRR